MVRFSEALEKDIDYDIETTKDRQENAIYAFTAISYLFLPLSAIAGIFGMNTADVRDMKYRQWLYWTVSIPVTAFVIFAGLWWTGELKNVVSWFRRKVRGLTESKDVMLVAKRKKKKRRYSSSYDDVCIVKREDSGASHNVRRRRTGGSRR